MTPPLQDPAGAARAAAALQLQDALGHLFACPRRHIGRYGYRMVQASGTLNNLYVSVGEAQALLGDLGLSSGAPPPETVPGLAELEAETVADWTTRSGRWAEAEHELPLETLRNRFRLTELQIRLLLAAAGPLLSVDLARLYTFAWADFAVKRPSVGFLTELVGESPAAAFSLQGELAADAPLVRHRLVELRDDSSWGQPTPALHRGVVVPEAVLAFLSGRGEAGLPIALAPSCTLTTPAEAPPRDALVIPPGRLAELAGVVERAVLPAAAGRPRIFLTGPAGAGRRSVVQALAAPLGWGVLAVDLARLAEHDADWPDRLAEACREALARRCVLLLRGDALFDDRDRWDRLAPAFRRLVEPYEGPLAIAARAQMVGLHRLLTDVFDVALGIPPTAEQRGLWARALERSGCRVDPELAGQLSRRFSISPGVVHAAVQEAAARATWRVDGAGVPALSAADVSGAVRKRLDHTLSQVAEPYTTSLTWDDVILPEDVTSTLNEILSQAKHREKVYDLWGFRRKMAYGRGLACLFCGPPGTGKTMMAGIIAQALGQEIYRVDLSRVISKWVGETEKNLARVFDEAESAQVILLFDEADSLFSSRTEVKGSNDRFANMEINYLLQRMEVYDGMSILTTNFEKAIDEAFKRRLKFRVNFPMPDPEHRAQLWRSMLPPEAQVAENVRFEHLGKKFTLAGGNIKNAVLRAAFYAAEGEGVISHELLEKAALAESREMGRL